VQDETPIGFWTDIAAQTRQELQPPISGFFAPVENGPVKGVLKGDVLQLQCANPFATDIINKPEVLQVVARKASAKLGRPIQAVAVDLSATGNNSEHMAELLRFGKAHSDIIKIK